MTPLWSILITVLPSRIHLLNRLLAVLEPQLVPGVEMLIRASDLSIPTGENREILRRESTAEYISIIDDDDLVSLHYVSRILPYLDGVDHVSFNLAEFWDNNIRCIAHNSIKFGVNGIFGGKIYYDLSHLCVTNRIKALTVPMEGYREDAKWMDAMRKLNVIKTEHHIPEVLYYYMNRTVRDEPEHVDWRKTRDWRP
jgi:hypothetical protein